MALLVSTTGVTIYTHFCNTDHVFTSSLFVIQDTCDLELCGENDCCVTENSCAVKNEQINGCCSTEQLIYKIKEDFYITSLAVCSFHPVQLQLFWKTTFSVVQEFGLPVFVKNILQPPPLLSGRDLIARFCQNKSCPDPLT